MSTDDLEPMMEVADVVMIKAEISDGVNTDLGGVEESLVIRQGTDDDPSEAALVAAANAAASYAATANSVTDASQAAVASIAVTALDAAIADTISLTFSPKGNKNKRKREWIDGHSLQYGVKVVELDPETGKVAKVSCRFCIHFGREENLETLDISEKLIDSSDQTSTGKKKRRKTENIKFFCKPFRTDKYNSHLESEHQTKWELYKNLSNDEKSVFFDYPALQTSSSRGISSSLTSNVTGIAYENISSPPPRASSTTTARINIQTPSQKTSNIIVHRAVQKKHDTFDADAVTTPTGTTRTATAYRTNDGKEMMIFLFNTNIIDLLIKGMMRKDEYSGSGKKSISNTGSESSIIGDLYKRVQNGTNNVNLYQTILSNVQQCKLVIINLANGLSFAQVCQTINDINSVLDLDEMDIITTITMNHLNTTSGLEENHSLTIDADSEGIDCVNLTRISTSDLVQDTSNERIEFLTNGKEPIEIEEIKDIMNDHTYENINHPQEVFTEIIAPVEELTEAEAVTIAVEVAMPEEATIMEEMAIAVESTISNLTTIAEGPTISEKTAKAEEIVHAQETATAEETKLSEETVEEQTKATPESNATKTTTKSKFMIGNASIAVVQNYSSIVCAHNYQQIFRILTDCCWGFSIHLNLHNLYTSIPFVDVRVVVFSHGNLHSFHICALPLRKGNADPKHLYDTFALYMDVLDPKWRHKLIGIQASSKNIVYENEASKRTKEMFRKITGLETLAAKQCDPSLHRELSGVTALEECVLHKFYCGILASDPDDRTPSNGNIIGKWCKDFSTISTYLRLETELCDKLGSSFPESALGTASSAFAWSSIINNTMPAAIRWISSKKVALYEHFRLSMQPEIDLIESTNHKLQKLSSNKPNVGDAFWIVLSLVDDVTDSVSRTFSHLLHAENLTMSNKIQSLESLLQDLKAKFKVEDSDVKTDEAVITEGLIQSKSYKLQLNKIADYWNEQCSFTQGLIEKQSQQYWTTISLQLGNLVLNLLEDLKNLIQNFQISSVTSDDGIVIEPQENGKIVADNKITNGINLETDIPWQPSKIAEMSAQVFSDILNRFKRQLETKYRIELPNCTVDSIKKEHFDFLEAYRAQPRLRATLEEVDKSSVMNFSLAWAPVLERYPDLYSFVGTIATKLISPHEMSGVEKSLINAPMFKWNEGITNQMVDMELESKFHALQWNELSSIAFIQTRNDEPYIVATSNEAAASSGNPVAEKYMNDVTESVIDATILCAEDSTKLSVAV